jgi:hypothetical protein
LRNVSAVKNVAALQIPLGFNRQPSRKPPFKPRERSRLDLIRLNHLSFIQSMQR